MKPKISILFLSFLFTVSCATTVPENTMIYNGSKIIPITVNGQGYQPDRIFVSNDVEKVTLSFKRVTDSTCAREVIYEDQNINKKLPLNKEVVITFDMKNKSKIQYGCHMNKMFMGEIIKN